MQENRSEALIDSGEQSRAFTKEQRRWTYKEVYGASREEFRKQQELATRYNYADTQVITRRNSHQKAVKTYFYRSPLRDGYVVWTDQPSFIGVFKSMRSVFLNYPNAIHCDDELKLLVKSPD